MLTTSDVEALATLPAEAALDQVATTIARLTRDPLLYVTHIQPLLDQQRPANEITVIPLSDASSPVSLQLFIWSPGAATAIHDHACWGAVGCLLGSLHEARYQRLDDETRTNYARLRKLWERQWTPAAGISTLLPYGGGIHQVVNASGALTISLHCYGPAGPIDGRDYDPRYNYVCDRLH